MHVTEAYVSYSLVLCGSPDTFNTFGHFEFGPTVAKHCTETFLQRDKKVGILTTESFILQTFSCHYLYNDWWVKSQTGVHCLPMSVGGLLTQAWWTSLTPSCSPGSPRRTRRTCQTSCWTPACHHSQPWYTFPEHRWLRCQENRASRPRPGEIQQVSIFWLNTTSATRWSLRSHETQIVLL